MPQNKFSALPLATILEICSYLDVESLMAVADVGLHHINQMTR